jgi:hypothetical protein
MNAKNKDHWFKIEFFFSVTSDLELPTFMLVWNKDESKAVPRIVLNKLDDNDKPYVVVCDKDREAYKSGKPYDTTSYTNAKQLPTLTMEEAEERFNRKFE